MNILIHLKRQSYRFVFYTLIVLRKSVLFILPKNINLLRENIIFLSLDLITIQKLYIEFVIKNGKYVFLRSLYSIQFERKWNSSSTTFMLKDKQYLQYRSFLTV